MPSERLPLHCHPASPNPGIDALVVEAGSEGGLLTILYIVKGDLTRIVWPSGEGGERRDELWQHTCFEAFFRPSGGARYAEFNFSPNGDWAAYAFEDYRTSGQDLTCAPPKIESLIAAREALFRITLPSLPSKDWPTPLLLGPSVILETQNGERSFWALHHPLSKPDFHRIENFKITLD